MRRNFYHPSTENMYAVIKRAEPLTTHYDMYDTMEKVGNTCDICQR